MRSAVIISGARTAVGTFGGSLKSTPVVQLGALVLKDTLRKAGLRPVANDNAARIAPQKLGGQGRIELEKQYDDYDDSLQPIAIDEVIMGNVVAAGQGQNVTRQAMIRAGISKETGAYTVNKLCASGMKTLALAAQAIGCGEADIIMAGGMENMSQIPYALPSTRWGCRMGPSKMIDLLISDGLHEVFYDYHMGVTAENIARQYDISRQAQDELALMSHQRAMHAIEKGLLKEEITPVTIPQRKGDPLVFVTDERPMATNMQKLARLRPAFLKDGTVTAGNASGIDDAAAAMLIISSDKARELGLTPIVKIKAWSYAGLDPAFMGLGPIPAVRKLLHKENLSMEDFGVVELNEAFAVQAIACMRELDCDPNKTNLLGSGISIGHPIGCTGARIVLSLMNQMVSGHHHLGLASLCIGGGQGMAMVLERV